MTYLFSTVHLCTLQAFRAGYSIKYLAIPDLFYLFTKPFIFANYAKMQQCLVFSLIQAALPTYKIKLRILFIYIRKYLSKVNSAKVHL